MKTSIKLLLLAVACLALAAANEERIRWTWNGVAPYAFSGNGLGTLEFGLRNDGVVVWREIKPAVTNSPAEKAVDNVWTNSSMIITNLVVTNRIWFYDGGTNSNTPFKMSTNMSHLVQPLYHYPSGTNSVLLDGGDVHEEIDWSRVAGITNALEKP